MLQSFYFFQFCIVICVCCVQLCVHLSQKKPEGDKLMLDLNIYKALFYLKPLMSLGVKLSKRATVIKVNCFDILIVYSRYSLLVLNTDCVFNIVMILETLGHNQYVYSRYLFVFNAISEDHCSFIEALVKSPDTNLTDYS